jgi:hypothetical protein
VKIKQDSWKCVLTHMSASKDQIGVRPRTLTHISASKRPSCDRRVVELVQAVCYSLSEKENSNIKAN